MVRDRNSKRFCFLWTFVGEAMVTFGLVLALFLAYDMWGTTFVVRVKQEQALKQLRESWRQEDPVIPESSKSTVDTPKATRRSESSENHPPPRQEHPPTRQQDDFLADHPIGIIQIPRLGRNWQAIIHESVHKKSVLDRGFVGHYSPTALPGAQGNVALAAHSITHGEPFAHLKKLRRGDRIYIETQHQKFEYVIDAGPYLTSPRDISVIAPVPRHSGFNAPGKYITLTTCWPPVTSSKRLIYWGHQVSSHPS